MPGVEPTLGFPHLAILSSRGSTWDSLRQRRRIKREWRVDNGFTRTGQIGAIKDNGGISLPQFSSIRRSHPRLVGINM